MNNRYERYRKYSLDDTLPAYGSNLDWPRIYELFEPYDIIRFKDEARGKYYTVDLSNRKAVTDKGDNWRECAIGNLIIRCPHKIQGKNLMKWEDIPL